MTERLGFRLAFLLSVALLPLGLIALSQTWQMAMDAESASETALIQRTSNAIGGEQAIVHGALGAAGALSQTVVENIANVTACSTMLRDFVARSPIYTFAGLVPADGKIRCSSAGEELDVSAHPILRKFAEAPRAQVNASMEGTVSREPVLMVSVPVTRDGVYLGMMVLSVPHRVLSSLRTGTGGPSDVDVVMMNQSGDVLLTEPRPMSAAEELLPADVSRDTLAGHQDPPIFRGRDGQGRERVFVAVPVVANLVYVLGSWDPERAQLSRDLISPATLLFPLTMWLTSLVVAYAAVDRLVIRHIRDLRGEMRRFALGRRDHLPQVPRNAPSEITEVSHTFQNLARIVMRDEAEREASLQEKTVLLKEIHHRVKNNLQLIASIMNMQIRRVREPGARSVLKSVQDRVTSLATIHRNLYQAESLSAVQADTLLGDIVRQMSVMTGEPGRQPEIETRFDPVSLYPDQAVPVALFTTEGLTNAMKYSTRTPAGDRRWIRVALVSTGPGKARLSVRNSRGGEEPVVNERTGIGTQLITAFAGQLGSQVEWTETEDSYEIAVEFDVAEFQHGIQQFPTSASGKVTNTPRDGRGH
ncbi:sensor histidine kinase [Frigidibacter sp. MR17.14]|uniref:sensor histidine kinase n=1 Tax=Frigidibacter sp. MR17.14 TaxID=3126509 RepID=UPI003012A9CF